MSLVWPWFLNLGIAPPAPRGATAFAPRAKPIPIATLGDPFTWRPAVYQPLAVYAYGIPVVQQFPGIPYTPPQRSQLLPNPYSSSQH